MCQGNEKGQERVRGSDAAGQQCAATEPAAQQEPQECGNPIKELPGSFGGGILEDKTKKRGSNK